MFVCMYVCMYVCMCMYVQGGGRRKIGVYGGKGVTFPYLNKKDWNEYKYTLFAECE